jgi:hypothetical protein
MVEYPAAARRWVQEPTYAKNSTIYVKQPFKPNYVLKMAAFELSLRCHKILKRRKNSDKDPGNRF